MLLYSYYNNDTGIKITELVEYNEEGEQNSRKLFEDLKKEKILFGNFDDKEWYISDEVSKMCLNFEFDEILYKKEFQKRNMYTFEQFVNSIKSYVILSIKQRSAASIRVMVNLLNKYMHATNYFNKSKYKVGLDSLGEIKFLSSHIRYIEGYAQYVNFECSEYYALNLNDLTEYSLALKLEDSQQCGRRKLSDFQSILLFNKIIERFWIEANSDSDIRDKQLYFPLYIWWKITNIIPLRLTEFCVTPYDCIKKTKDGKFYIYLRRSAIKCGKNKEGVSHKIESDYKICKYAISKEIVDLINEYKRITSKNRKDNDRLLCYVTYILRAMSYDDERNTNTEIYRYNFSRYSLYSLVKRFFIEVVQNKYNYEIINTEDFIHERITVIEKEQKTVELEFKPLEENQISIFKLGDIRHYAMINLVLNDISPILIRELVDHSDINTSFHYFGNTSELVKCISYMKYKEICEKMYDKNGNNKVFVTTNQILNRLEYTQSVLVDNGRCVSKAFISGKLDSCIVVDGECEICDFFIQEKAVDKETKKAKLKIIESKIDAQAKLIEELLSSHKNTLQRNKKLIQSTLNLQSAMQLYYEESVKHGGVIWEQ